MKVEENLLEAIQQVIIKLTMHIYQVALLNLGSSLLINLTRGGNFEIIINCLEIICKIIFIFFILLLFSILYYT